MPGGVARSPLSFGDQSLRGLAPAGHARLGIGRSFQQMELCDSLTVWDNVVLGLGATMAGASLVHRFVGRRNEEK